MKRFAYIGTAVVLTLLGAYAIRAQDKPTTQPTATPAAEREARKVAEAYMAAALAGKSREAGELLTAKTALSARINSEKWLKQFRDALGLKSLEIKSVGVKAEQGVGLAVSKPFKLPKPSLDVGVAGCVALQLKREEGRWRVRDVDIWSPAVSAKALKRYETPSVGKGSDVEYSTSKPSQPTPAGRPSPSRSPQRRGLGGGGGGFGGGGFGGGGGGGFGGGFGSASNLPGSGSSSPNYTVGLNVVISVSEKGDAVMAFSKSLGKWTKQEIRPASKKKLGPVVGSSVAGLQIGQTIYAYSGQTGRWDILRVAKDRKPRMMVHSDMVLVTDDRTVYTFASATGRWSSSDDDAIPKTSTNTNREHIDRLTQRLQQHEDQSLDLARQLHDLKSAKNSNKEELSKLKGQLRQAVSDAFLVRQELQQAELEELRTRLIRIGQLIETREQIEEKIIDRRVEELLNRELSWDAKDAE